MKYLFFARLIILSVMIIWLSIIELLNYNLHPKLFILLIIIIGFMAYSIDLIWDIVDYEEECDER